MVISRPCGVTMGVDCRLVDVADVGASGGGASVRGVRAARGVESLLAGVDAATLTEKKEKETKDKS